MDRETQQSGDWIGRRPMHATDDGLSSPLAATFFAADRWRRWRGGWLDALGLGPRETPWRSVDVAAGVRLHCYDGAREPDAVPVLLVPAPIKQPYIWDLLPRISVVRRCLEAGLRVYLAAWRAPEPGQRDGGLAEYADQFLAACLRVIAAEFPPAAAVPRRPFARRHARGTMRLAASRARWRARAARGAPEVRPRCRRLRAVAGGLATRRDDRRGTGRRAGQLPRCGRRGRSPGELSVVALARRSGERRRRRRDDDTPVGPPLDSGRGPPVRSACSKRLPSNSTAPTPSPKGRCGSADAQPCPHVSRACRSRLWSIPRAGSSRPLPRWPCSPAPSRSTTPARPASASGMSASWSAGRRTLSCGRS